MQGVGKGGLVNSSGFDHPLKAAYRVGLSQGSEGLRMVFLGSWDLGFAFCEFGALWQLRGAGSLWGSTGLSECGVSSLR